MTTTTLADEAHAEAIDIAEYTRASARDLHTRDAVTLMRATHWAKRDAPAGATYLLAADSMERVARIESRDLMDAWLIGRREQSAVTR